MNLTYINVTFTGKVLRWKMYISISKMEVLRTSTSTMSLERNNVNSFQMPCPGYVLITYLLHLRPVMNLPQDVYDRLTDIHNSIWIKVMQAYQGWSSI